MSPHSSCSFQTHQRHCQTLLVAAPRLSMECSCCSTDFQAHTSDRMFSLPELPFPFTLSQISLLQVLQDQISSSSLIKASPRSALWAEGRWSASFLHRLSHNPCQSPFFPPRDAVLIGSYTQHDPWSHHLVLLLISFTCVCFIPNNSCFGLKFPKFHCSPGIPDSKF